MTLKINKRYKCRNGKNALITKHIDKLFVREIYTVGGKILNDDGSLSRIAYWMPSGRYNVQKESEFDIIGEI